jgi:hypothetical protein
MTVLGKVLAVLNLVLSLFVGYFIIANYVTRTNWHTAYAEVEKQLKVARQEANTYRAEADEAKGKIKSQADDLRAINDKLKANDEVAAVQIRELKSKLEAELAKNKVVQTTSVGLTSETGRRQNEVEYLKGLLAARDDKMKNMEKQVEDSRAAAVEAQIAANSERERNNNLLAQNEKLTKEIQKGQQAQASTVGPRKNPPAEDVEGVVKATDPQSGYVTITIGTDAGIHKGNTLEVYRLRPEPAYLGTIEILAVHSNEAVGKPVSRMRGQIQVGDTVSSTIVSRR